MTIKTKDQLATEFSDDALRGTASEITPEMLRDFLDSLGVGAIMKATNIDPVPVTTDWEPIPGMETVKKTHGITADLPTASFTLQTDSDGEFTASAVVLLHSDVPGWLDIGIFEGTNLIGDMRRTFAADEEKLFAILDGDAFVGGDTITLAIRGEGNAPTQISAPRIFFRAVRA